MSGGGDATLFEESFTITEYDQSKYDRVARISCTSGDSQTVMVLDINMELFPCAVSDNLHVLLSTTLSPDGARDDEKGWRDVGKSSEASATLADLYDYVCYGKIYKFEETFDGATMYDFSLFVHLARLFGANSLQQQCLYFVWRSSHVAAGTCQEADPVASRQCLPVDQEIDDF